ncbi:hypothetical protein FOMPIDRAFT_1053162 [Fomitopsis schrenkii]|uniref:Uncharacterized protein n=1 Tax=Fomitopsis schrenkii TaxID=2126942 RepID=S8DTE2_FOMSC|nr:hypothetical protein FOMPIDRAFT_1053162 [Fomitopsis schrenkii]
MSDMDMLPPCATNRPSPTVLWAARHPHTRPVIHLRVDTLLARRSRPFLRIGPEFGLFFGFTTIIKPCLGRGTDESLGGGLCAVPDSGGYVVSLGWDMLLEGPSIRAVARLGLALLESIN